MNYTKEEINEMVNTPLNGAQMQILNPNAKIYTYDQLLNFKTIEDLFRDTNKVIILYLVKNPHFGHWCCLFKQPRGYNFFDPYGEMVDDELNYLTKQKRKELHEERKYLHYLLQDKTCYYNYICFQGKKSQTCGCHTSYRLQHSHLTIEEYAKQCFIDKGINNPDIIVAEHCFTELGKV